MSQADNRPFTPVEKIFHDIVDCDVDLSNIEEVTSKN